MMTLSSEVGQSQVTGTVLLVGITVVLSGVVGGYFLGFTDIMQEPGQGAVEVSESSDGNVTFTLVDKSNSEELIIRTSDGEEESLTRVGESKSFSSDQSFVVLAVTEDGGETVIRQYEPTSSSATLPYETETPTPSPTPSDSPDSSVGGTVDTTMTV